MAAGEAGIQEKTIMGEGGIEEQTAMGEAGVQEKGGSQEESRRPWGRPAAREQGHVPESDKPANKKTCRSASAFSTSPVQCKWRVDASVFNSKRKCCNAKATVGSSWIGSMISRSPGWSTNTAGRHKPSTIGHRRIQRDSQPPNSHELRQAMAPSDAKHRNGPTLALNSAAGYACNNT